MSFNLTQFGDFGKNAFRFQIDEIDRHGVPEEVDSQSIHEPSRRPGTAEAQRRAGPLLIPIVSDPAVGLADPGHCGSLDSCAANQTPHTQSQQEDDGT